MRMVSKKNRDAYMKILLHRTIVVVLFGILILLVKKHRLIRHGTRMRFSVLDRIPDRIRNMRDLVQVSDEDCRDQLRMDRATFHKLCYLLQSLCGLKCSRNITDSVEEKVAMFLSILAHHTKNRCVKFQFKRSGQIVSKHFHSVLRCLLRLHTRFSSKPTPVQENDGDQRWGKFQGCLGVLDGTYVDVHVPTSDKGRYMNRKGQVSVNVLGVCDMNMQFVYILTGWEGYAPDSRVLRDAINRVNGLRVPKGNYYLCDNGYPNCEGFLTPYKGVMYHLNEWTARRPQNYQEYFNM